MRLDDYNGTLVIVANRDECLRMAKELIEIAQTAKQVSGGTPTTFTNSKPTTVKFDGIVFRRGS